MLALVATLLASPALAGEVSYTLDKAKSELYILVYKDPSTLGAGLSHDHVVLATGWTGSVTWDPANPAACQVNLTVPAKSLKADPPDLRTRAGLGPGPDDDARKDIQGHLLAEDQLWATKHPNIHFASTACAGTGDDVTVSGTLTIRGKANAVSLPMKLRADATSFSASGSLTIKATDYGFEPYSALFGQLKNRDEMKLVVSTVGINAGGSPAKAP